MSFDIRFDAPSAAPVERVMAVPHDVHAAGSETFLVQPAARARATPVDALRLELLQACTTLDRPQDHAWRLARAIRHPDPASLLPVIDELRRAGLLIDEAAILRAGQPSEERPVAPLDSLFIRSSGRARTLARALGTLAPYAHQLRRCVIVDDTRSAELRAAVDDVLDAFRDRLDCELVHFRRDQRRDLVERLAQNGEIDPERLAWFVSTPPDREDGYGCGINLALLLSAGRRALLLDDDASLEVSEIGPASPCALTLHHLQAGSGLPSDTRVARPSDLDPIAEHERILGRTPGHLPQPPEAVEQASPDLLLWWNAESRVRFTSNGVHGDPGTRQPHWLFALSKDALAPWAGADGYRQSLRERSAVRCEDGPKLISDYSVMTTTLTGIDNRIPTPPTLPFSVGEDTALGELVRYTDPGSMLHAAPWLLRHSPEQPRHWTREDVATPLTHNVGTFFKHVLIADAWSRRARDGASRRTSLRSLMDDLARADTGDLEAELFRQTTARRAGHSHLVENRRSDWTGHPEVHEDMGRMIEANRARSWHADDDPDADLATIRRLARGYAEGLEHWQAAWEAARDLGPEVLLR